MYPRHRVRPRLVSASDEIGPQAGPAVLATPVSCAMICCVRSARLRQIRSGATKPHPANSYARTGCRPSRPQAPATPWHHVVIGLLRRERAAGGLRREIAAPRIAATSRRTARHRFVPDAARRAVFGDFLEKFIVRIEENERRGRNRPVQAAPEAPFHVFDSVAQRERQSDRRRTRLSNVVAAD